MYSNAKLQIYYLAQERELTSAMRLRWLMVGGVGKGDSEGDQSSPGGEGESDSYLESQGEDNR